MGLTCTLEGCPPCLCISSGIPNDVEIFLLWVTQLVCLTGLIGAVFCKCNVWKYLPLLESFEMEMKNTLFGGPLTLVKYRAH